MTCIPIEQLQGSDNSFEQSLEDSSTSAKGPSSLAARATSSAKDREAFAYEFLPLSADSSWNLESPHLKI